MYKIYRTKEAEYNYLPLKAEPDGNMYLTSYVTRGDLLSPAVTLDDLIKKINAAGEVIVQILETPGPHHAIVVQGGEHEDQI